MWKVKVINYLYQVSNNTHYFEDKEKLDGFLDVMKRDHGFLIVVYNPNNELIDRVLV